MTQPTAKHWPAFVSITVRQDDGSGEVYEFDGRTANVEAEMTAPGMPEHQMLSDAGERRYLSVLERVELHLTAQARFTAREIPGMPAGTGHPGAVLTKRTITDWSDEDRRNPAVRAVLALHAPEDVDADQTVCGYCAVEWPCLTVRTIDAALVPDSKVSS